MKGLGKDNRVNIESEMRNEVPNVSFNIYEMGGSILEI